MNDKYLDYWAGKTVLITGGSSGIGFAVANYINGIAKNIILVASDFEVLNEAELKLHAKSDHSNIMSLVCNIGDAAKVKLMANKVIISLGCPDILINNAGFAHYHTFDQMSGEEVEETANVNFLGFYVLHTLLLLMLLTQNLMCVLLMLLLLQAPFQLLLILYMAQLKLEC